MRLLWGILGLLLVTLLALPARADAIYDVSGTATLTGNDTCGGVCVETISFSFQLDEYPVPCGDLPGCQGTTGYDALLANNLTITASGPLGAPPPPGNSAFADDNFMAITFGGNLSNEFDLVMNPFPPPGFPFTPTGIGGYLYNCATANCFGFCPFTNTGPGNCDQNEAMHVTITPVNGDLPVGPATTPEPQTWAMLWIGLIGLALMKFAPGGKRLRVLLPLRAEV